MRLAAILLILAVLGGQAPEQPSVFTTEQAEAGRMEIQKNAFGNCTDCHTRALTGRFGEPGESPAVSSLPEDYQKLINGNGGRVPAFVGPTFVKRWAARSTKDLSKEFQERFEPPLTEETRLNLIAYILQVNGALPGKQPLTMNTDVEIRALIPVK